jgi:L-fuculose-phosphate aldolase
MTSPGRTELEVREEIIRVCLRMVELGINQGTAGNVSVRDGSHFFVTPSGIAYDRMTPDQIAVMDYAGRYWGPHPPTTEWRFHREIMRRRPDAGAVIHTHSIYSTAVACLRRDIPALHYYVAVGGGPTVRCATYATYGTQELAENAIEALAGRTACLLANHGMIVIGTTLSETLKRTFDLEVLARQYIYAAQLGEPIILPDDEIERVRLKLYSYGSPQSSDPELVHVDQLPVD